MVIDPNDLSEFDNVPDEALSGLSSRELLALQLFPFMDASPLKIRTNIGNDDLDNLPFFNLCEQLLVIVDREVSLKLTPSGYLPIAIVKELYGKRIVLDYLIEDGISKRYLEQEIIVIAAARQVCTLAGLIKKRSNKLSLTKNGQKLRADRYGLFRKILITHSYDFDTWQFDGYPDRATALLGSHATWYLLLRYGLEPRPTLFYAEKYLDLFPGLIDSFNGRYAPPIHQFARCFETRSFYRFNDWWGFTQTSDPYKGEFATTKATELMARVLEFVRSAG